MWDISNRMWMKQNHDMGILANIMGDHDVLLSVSRIATKSLGLKIAGGFGLCTTDVSKQHSTCIR